MIHIYLFVYPACARLYNAVTGGFVDYIYGYLRG